MLFSGARVLTEKVVGMEVEQKNQRKILNTMSSVLNSSNGSGTSGSNAPYQHIDPDRDFPVATIEQFNHLNTNMEDNPSYLREVVS